MQEHANNSTPNTDWTPSSIKERIQSLGDWFHNLNLRGVQTAPHHFLGDYPAIKWNRFSHAIPEDLRGKSVLDIGCNAGFYSLAMKRRGADRVVGIDSDPLYLQQAQFAAEVEGVEIDFRQLSVYELPDLHEQFDVVLFLGVLYHLRYPLLALDIIRRQVVKDIFIVQSMLRGSSDIEPLAQDYPFEETHIFDRPSFPRMYFIEKRYAHDPTNWWIPNEPCLEAMLRSSGFQIVSHPENEVFVCRPSTITDKQRELPPGFSVRDSMARHDQDKRP